MWDIIEKGIYTIFCKWLHLNIIRRNWDKFFQFLQFGIVGIINNVVFYIVYVVLVLLEFNYLVANAIAFTVSILNSFYWNNKYVFCRKRVSKLELLYSFLKTFICYAITGIVLNNVLLIVWIECFNIHKMAAPIINLIITIPINFILNKFWAFKDK